MSDLNATYTVAADGTLTITHRDCGQTQTVAPAWEDPESGKCGYGSDAHFCSACESNGRPSTLRY